MDEILTTAGGLELEVNGVISNCSDHGPDTCYKCGICGIDIMRYDTFIIHKEAHNLKCSHCDRHFLRLKALQKHRIKVYQKSKYTCHECGAVFACEQEGVKHYLSHVADERMDIDCELCGKRFSSSEMFMHMHLKHRKSHTKFKCSECDERFQTLQMRRLHYNVDHSAKTCKYCGAIFYCRTKFNRHLMSQIKDRNYRCQKCFLTFSSRNWLAVHAKGSHAGESVLFELIGCTTCNYCKESFDTIYNLNAHIRCSHLNGGNNKAPQTVLNHMIGLKNNSVSAQKTDESDEVKKKMDQSSEEGNDLDYPPACDGTKKIDGREMLRKRSLSNLAGECSKRTKHERDGGCADKKINTIVTDASPSKSRICVGGKRLYGNKLSAKITAINIKNVNKLHDHNDYTRRLLPVSTAELYKQSNEQKIHNNTGVKLMDKSADIESNKTKLINKQLVGENRNLTDRKEDNKLNTPFVKGNKSDISSKNSKEVKNVKINNTDNMNIDGVIEVIDDDDNIVKEDFESKIIENVRSNNVDDSDEPEGIFEDLNSYLACNVMVRKDVIESPQKRKLNEPVEEIVTKVDPFDVFHVDDDDASNLFDSQPRAVEEVGDIITVMKSNISRKLAKSTVPSPSPFIDETNDVFVVNTSEENADFIVIDDDDVEEINGTKVKSSTKVTSKIEAKPSKPEPTPAGKGTELNKHLTNEVRSNKTNLKTSAKTLKLEETEFANLIVNQAKPMEITNSNESAEMKETCKLDAEGSRIIIRKVLKLSQNKQSPKTVLEFVPFKRIITPLTEIEAKSKKIVEKGITLSKSVIDESIVIDDDDENEEVTIDNDSIEAKNDTVVIDDDSDDDGNEETTLTEKIDTIVINDDSEPACNTSLYKKIKILCPNEINEQGAEAAKSNEPNKQNVQIFKAMEYVPNAVILNKENAQKVKAITMQLLNETNSSNEILKPATASTPKITTIKQISKTKPTATVTSKTMETTRPPSPTILKPGITQKIKTIANRILDKNHPKYAVPLIPKSRQNSLRQYRRIRLLDAEGFPLKYSQGTAHEPNIDLQNFMKAQTVGIVKQATAVTTIVLDDEEDTSKVVRTYENKRKRVTVQDEIDSLTKELLQKRKDTESKANEDVEMRQREGSSLYKADSKTEED